MIDIREVAKEIAGLKINDPAARLAAIHGAVRNYGAMLLASLHDAIQPTTQEEIAVVDWLRKELVRVIAQIPEPIQPKKETIQ